MPSRRPLRVVAIGCGGFVGSHLLERLLVEPAVHVEGWDPDVAKIRTLLGHPGLTMHAGACSDAEQRQRLENAIMRADVVFNLAAICNPSEYNTRPIKVLDANLFDVQPIVQMCAKHRRWLIHFSTSEVYGRTLASYSKGGAAYDDRDSYELREDETPLIMGPIANQRWTYACAKQLIERLIYAHHRENGLPYTVIRPLNFFGPRMDYIPTREGDGVPRVLASFMAALLHRTPMKLVDGGKARRTIVSVHEAVDAIMLMLETPERARNQVFNIGNPDNEVSIAELARLMRRTYAEITHDASYLMHPIQDVSGLEFYGPGYEDCDRRMPDIGKAQRLLGWRPTQSISDILSSTMRHFHEQHLLRSVPALQQPGLLAQPAA